MAATHTSWSSEFLQTARYYQDQVEIEVLRASKQKVETYFDTRDIFAMIQGIWQLDTGLKLDRELFESPRFLVGCLAYAGFVDGLTMLSPHRIELSNKIQNIVDLPHRAVPEDKIGEFLAWVDIDWDELKTLGDSKKRKQYLEALTSNAYDLFKVNALLDGPNWDTRGGHLFHQKEQGQSPIIRFDEATYDVPALIDTPLFKALHQTIRKNRPSLELNNLRDALALTMIADKVRLHNAHYSASSGRSKHALPLFFASSEVMRHVLNSNDLGAHFEAKWGKDKSIIVLKDADYFIIDAIFNASNKFEKDTLFNNIPTENLPVKAKTEEIIYEKREQISTEAEKYKTHQFFKEFWFKQGSLQLHEQLIALIGYDEEDDEERLKDTFKRENKKLVKSLTENLEKLQLIEKIWKSLLHIDKYFSDKINKDFYKLDEVPDIFSELGLTRFSPPTGEIEHKIKDLWLLFWQHKTEPTVGGYKRAKTQLMSLAIDGIYKNKLDDLLVAVCILWVFGEFQLIDDILKLLNKDYKHCYHLALIHAASIYRAGKWEINTIHEILTCIAQKGHEDNNYKFWMAKGFILFHVWHINSNAPLIPEQSDVAANSNLKKYYEEAIIFTRRAYDWLLQNPSEDSQKATYRYVKTSYCLNNYIYYLTRSTPKETFLDMESKLSDWVDILIGREEHWQSRFDHTIATFYYRKYRIHGEVEDKKKAAEFMETCFKNAPIILNEYKSLQSMIERA